MIARKRKARPTDEADRQGDQDDAVAQAFAGAVAFIEHVLGKLGDEGGLKRLAAGHRLRNEVVG